MYSILPGLVSLVFISYGAYVLNSRGANRASLTFFLVCITTFCWQAAWAPVGEDGYPKPLWDKLTGRIDRSVATLVEGLKKRGVFDNTIIFIMSDDQDVATMQYMPRVQELLAAQGVTFNNSFVTSSICCPSREREIREAARRYICR